MQPHTTGTPKTGWNKAGADHTPYPVTAVANDQNSVIGVLFGIFQMNRV